MSARLLFVAWTFFGAYASVYAQPPANSEIAWYLGGDTQVVQIEQAELVYSQADQPPEAGWQQVILPDAWFVERRKQHTQAWYRVKFETDSLSGQGDWALFIPRLSAHGEIWLNGVFLQETDRRTDPLPNRWNYPVFVTLPSSQLLQGANELHVRLTVERSRIGNLYELYLGPDLELSSLYQFSYFTKVTLAQAVTVIMLLTAGLLGYLSWLGAPSPVYRWFLFGALLWAIHSMHLHVTQIPFPVRIWHGLYATAHAGSAICFLIATHRLLQLRRRAVELVLIGVFSLIVGTSVALPEEYLAFVTSLSLFTAWYVVIHLGMLLIIHAIFLQRQRWLWLALPGSVALFMACWDVVSFFSGFTSLFAKYPYIPVLALVTGGVVFLKRFAVDQKRLTQLETTQQRVAQDAVAQERRRLMQEIHDGVGGHLVSTLSLLEQKPETQPEVMDAVRASLGELRTLVNSLETIGQIGDLVSLLAMLRDRLERFLQPHGIELVWAVEPLPQLDKFGPEESLHVMRIVQEAVTNVIKHSNASQVELSCSSSAREDGEPGVEVQITNNGAEPSETNINEGYGISNLTDRARTLGGHFNFALASGCGVATLWLPLSGRQR
ncbi:MAG: hypothetical protein AAF541_12580 [Pseudomonadota bacterium]